MGHSDIASSALVLDIDNQCLWRDGQRVPLTVKSYALLRCLVEQRPNLVTKRVVLDTVWATTRVEEGQVKQFVAELRRILDDDPQAPRLIENVRGRGYRFIGEIAVIGSVAGKTSRVVATRAVVRNVPGCEETLPLFGRQSALDRIRQCLDRAVAGHTTLALIEGPAGCGKTSLAATFIQHAAGSMEFELLRAQCVQPEDFALPFGSVLDVVDRRLACKDGADAAVQLSRHAPGWVALRAQNGVEADRTSPSVPTLAPHLQREFCRWLEALATHRPVLLWLDDLHCADADSLRLLQYVMRQPLLGPILIVATSAPIDEMLPGERQRTLAQLIAGRGVTQIGLEALDVAAVGAWLGARWPAPDGRWAPCLHALTLGNAAVLAYLLDHVGTEDLRALVASGAVSGPIAQRAGKMLPAAFRRLGERLLYALNDEDRALLEIASNAHGAVDAEVDAENLVRALNCPPAQLQHRLEVLADEGRVVRRVSKACFGSEAATQTYRIACALRWHLLRTPAGNNTNAPAQPG